MLKVGGHLDPGHGDEPDARIVNLAPGQQLAQLLADLIPDTVRTISLRHTASGYGRSTLDT